MEHRPENFETAVVPTWCPGCGNFALWTALKRALTELNIPNHRTVVVFDIGCSGNGSNWVKAYNFHGLHGRSLPLATGVALANHGVKTIVISGDGAAYGEGLSHFIHTMRANPDVTYIVEDNQLYGLTKGQVSPTSVQGFKTESTPYGSLEEPLNPLALAISTDCSYVARSFAGDLPHLQKMIVGAIQHKGFALIDVFQPCVTFNHLNTYAWFYQKVRDLETLGHAPTDRDAAWKQAMMTDEYFPVGLFFQRERSTYADGVPALSAGPLAEQPLPKRDLSELWKSMS